MRVKNVSGVQPNRKIETSGQKCCMAALTPKYQSASVILIGQWKSGIRVVLFGALIGRKSFLHEALLRSQSESSMSEVNNAQPR